jgi:citrate lyase subunit beta/citryl-CoA lyase
MQLRPRRSALYMPASNPRAIAKARGLACDVVILDLEDAVSPEAKADARAAAVAAVREGGFGRRELVVRINAPDTEWGAADLAALAEVAPDAVLVPKVSVPADLAVVRAALPQLPLWAMIETPAALLRLDAICGSPGIAAFVVGPNDLALAMRMRVDAARTQLHGLLAQVVAAARAHGLVALDGVCNALDDPDRLAAECAQGAALGFDGKTLIHPNQIDAANTAFTPDADAVARAQAIVAAFAAPEAAGRGAIRLDGTMVERLHLAEAEYTLALAAAAPQGDCA